MSEAVEGALGGVQIVEGVTLIPEAQTILMMDSGADFRLDYDINPIRIGSYQIAPWGEDNLLPNHLLKKIGDNDIVSANVRFNRDVCYGLGPKLIRVLASDKGKITDWEEVTDGPEYEFFERNDIPMYIQQQLTDMVMFYNTFPLMRYERNGTKIHTIRHREAAFSRWSMMDRRGRINFHYYSSEWHKNPTKDDITCTRVLDEFNAVQELKMYAADRRDLIFPAYMPSPGRPYYSRPEWHSIFTSGWYDHSCMVPQLKKAILKNQLGIKYIIYISPDYFKDIYRKEGVSETDLKACKEIIEREKKAFVKFLTGEENANKTLMATKSIIPSASGSASESKWIEIEPIKNDLKGGEYIDDTESTANIICYAMGVHSALIGATPGKNSNTLGGSNARELYLIKQAMMKPIVDRCMRPLRVIKEYNEWDKNIMITMPEYIFTTLDQNKSGKEESTNPQA